MPAIGKLAQYLFPIKSFGAPFGAPGRGALIVLLICICILICPLKDQVSPGGTFVILGRFLKIQKKSDDFEIFMQDCPWQELLGGIFFLFFGLMVQKIIPFKVWNGDGGQPGHPLEPMNLKCQIGAGSRAQRVEEGWGSPNNGRESGREDPTKLDGLNIYIFYLYFFSRPFQVGTGPVGLFLD